MAAQRAKEAERAMMIKSADLSRVRDPSGGGVLLTTARAKW
jgi:hypothetical protein